MAQISGRFSIGRLKTADGDYLTVLPEQPDDVLIYEESEKMRYRIEFPTEDELSAEIAAGNVKSERSQDYIRLVPLPTRLT